MIFVGEKRVFKLFQLNLNSFLPRDMIIPRGQEKKVYVSCSLWQVKLLLLGDMIVPQGKKGLSCSMGQLKLLLLRDMIVPQRKNNFPKEQWTFPKERFKFFEKTYVSNIFAIAIISCFFHMIYFWKDLTTTLWLKAFQSKFIWKNYDHTKFQTHLSSRKHGCSLKQLKPLLPWTHGCPKEQLSSTINWSKKYYIIVFFFL